MKKGSNIKACAFVNIKMKKTGKFVDDQNIMIKKKKKTYKNKRKTKFCRPHVEPCTFLLKPFSLYKYFEKKFFYF